MQSNNCIFASSWPSLAWIGSAIRSKARHQPRNALMLLSDCCSCHQFGASVPCETPRKRPAQSLARPLRLAPYELGGDGRDPSKRAGAGRDAWRGLGKRPPWGTGTPVALARQRYSTSPSLFAAALSQLHSRPVNRPGCLNLYPSNINDLQELYHTGSGAM